MRNLSPYSIFVEIKDSTPPVACLLNGRDAWAAVRLIEAGEQGIEPIKYPGARWSAYVYSLREFGFDIETVMDEHGGQYPGKHGRYVLLSDVEILDGGDND